MNPQLARELTRRSPTLLTWRVASVAHADELVAWGVDGVIIDELDVARAIIDRRASPAATQPRSTWPARPPAMRRGAAPTHATTQPIRQDPPMPQPHP